MAYVAPTPSSFKARHPEFASVADARVQAVLEEVMPHVGPTWRESDRAPAQMYLTAHLLVMEGALMPSAAQVGGIGGIGSVSVGDTSISLRSSSSGSGAGSHYDQTTYGQRYMELLRMNFGGPRVA